MKSFFRFSTLCAAAALTFSVSILAAMIPALQSFTGSTFYLGFPSAFFSVHVSQVHGFVTHLNLSGLLLDIGFGYLICAFVESVVRKRKV